MLDYENIPAELLEKLEANFISAVRYEDLADGWREIDDVILLRIGSKIDGNRLNGYYLGGSPGTWFDFVAKPYVDDEAKQMELVRNVLLALDADE